MILRQTIMFFPKDSSDLVKVEIYTDDKVINGLWNLDNNTVLLNDKLYGHFRDCNTQSLQRKFFDSLQKVSSYLIS